ncbi:AAHS family 4-hydroxybenzoate transporter-like MFS transporter [Roseiarcus fermentans]|uniref:AAHS family 4-hydroxybenzoate transporter-like MFS transporter n=1 Tax=Roseiarcus fermentans TaxID=1473586 RepID=A0A366F9T2_9HYPH|nr:MFS transporter [Roseiarcus fermentans]RBP11371.1 AAHS family 4-hydroxybenzoate transporter-like MFS transporter [Roseiarcus fermentans]
MTVSPAKTINISRAIDEGGFGVFQLRAIALCALVGLFDGIDSQSIAIAAPIIARGLNLSRGSLGPVFSASLLGAMLGALTFGPLGDRFGRKRMLIVATALFSLFTLATAYADSYTGLIAIRFLAGIGLGGATPCFISLATEYAPRRRRATVASLIWAAFPLGGMLGGFVNAVVIASLGWRAMFVIGGVLPLLVAAALLLWLPESARFLLATGRDTAELRRIVARLVPAAPPGARIVADELHVRGVSVARLFAEGRGAATALMWICFFTAFAVLAIVVVWTPLLLNESGLGSSQAALVLGFHGFGALLGVASAGRLMERFGFTNVLGPAFVLGALATGTLGFAAGSIFFVSVAAIFVGVFVGVAASGSIALAAVAYPTAMRSSGVGWAMGAGRLGQVAAPLLASLLVGLAWRGSEIFLAFGVFPLVGALAVVAMGWGKEGANEPMRRSASAYGVDTEA